MDLNALKIGDVVDFVESESYSGNCLLVVSINGNDIGLEVEVDGSIDDEIDTTPQVIYVKRNCITNIHTDQVWEFRVYDDMGAYSVLSASIVETGYTSKNAALDAARDVVGDKDRIVKVQSGDREEIETYHATRAGWDVIS